MAGPEKHSKKPKAVTIDMAANAETPAEPQAYSGTPGPVSDVAFGRSPEIDLPAPEAPVSDEPEHVRERSTPSPEPTLAAPVPQGSTGFFGKVGAGLAGGLIALAGAAGLQFGGVLPNLGSNPELAALKAEVEKLASVPSFDPAPVLGEIQTLKDQIAAVDGRIAGLPSGGGDAAALKTVEEKIAALEAALAAGPAGGGADNAALQALSAKVSQLESAQPSPGGASAVALAIAASGLKAAIDRGGPFMSELETYASVAPASADIDALRALAATGVPSRQDLVARFDDAANAMLAASRTPDPDAGILQRLTDSAKNLVKARPVGDIAGDSPEALVARMEVVIGRGDLDAALLEAGKLPAPAQEAAKAYLDQVKARRDTDALVAKALQMALTAAGGKS